MGDGSVVNVSEGELRRDLEDGTKDAAERAGVPPLTEDDLKFLFEIYSSPSKIVSVEPGNEIVLSFDAGTLKLQRLGINTGRIHNIQIMERALGADTMEMGHIDYSFKPVKPILGDEQQEFEQALLVSTLPLFYGAMPNLAIYSQPDGPLPNPAELLPMGKISEARASQEEAVEMAVKDIVYIASAMYESGADGINFDTTGAAGDPDFLATLRATKILKEKYPDLCIELGMANEFILGMHGDMEYEGVRLAGLYPHDQLKLVEEAGVTIFGPTVNTNTSKSCPWNVARAITFIKPCVQNSRIPIHANMGMGVGGAPVVDNPPTDAISRASKAMVEICRLDGL
jgi:dimethylamine---corrinoid protein Co-methyltransferase